MSFEGLNIQTSNIEESDLDAILNGIPEATVTADSLAGAKIEPEEVQEEEFKFDTELSLDDILPKETKEKETPVEEVENKEVETSKAEEPKEPKTKGKVKAEELSDDALKQITDFYIEKGYWKDFEGRDEIEYNAETFQELLVKQNEEIANEKFEAILDNVGDVGKAIIKHISEGGKADEIIDLFKEQKEVEEFSAETPQEKKLFIAKYYKEVHGWSDDKIRRAINSAEADDVLDEEVKEIQNSYSKFYEKEFQKLEQDTQEKVVKQKQLQEKFENDITTEILSRKNITDKDKQYLKETILNYDQKLPDGTKVSKFYLKFAEMQENTADYVDFVQFVLDKNKFIEKIRKVEETKATEKAYFKIKSNAAAGNKTGSSHLNVSSNKEVEEFKWGNF